MTVTATETRLAQILDVRLLASMLADGYVRAQTHPVRPLVIYNYTEKAAYENVWNEVTLTCRGVIVDMNTDVIIARPFRKFFNYGQAGAPELDLHAPAIVTDKLDGSLGITYPEQPGSVAIATRGSFSSGQAVHATAILRNRYRNWTPTPGLTALFEIIYPANRIVVDYGRFDDLVMIGAVDIATGDTYDPDQIDWPGPKTTVFAYATLGEALVAPPRPNAEGLVVHLSSAGERVKIKQEDYVALHRIVTGLNARVVWEHLVDGRGVEPLLENLPDEFHTWVHGVADALSTLVSEQRTQIEKAYGELISTLPDGFTRKELAALATQHTWGWALFARHDGKDYVSKLWRQARPSGEWTPSGRTFGEDTA